MKNGNRGATQECHLEASHVTPSLRLRANYAQLVYCSGVRQHMHMRNLQNEKPSALSEPRRVKISGVTVRPAPLSFPSPRLARDSTASRV
jgi:hypothetical protein